MDLFLFTNRIKEIEDAGINVDLMFDGMEDKVTITMSKDDYHVRKTFIDLTYTKDNRYIDFELDLMVKELVRLEEDANKPKEPEAFNKEILVVQVGALLTKDKMDEIRQEIVSQLADGVVFIPPYMNAKILQVPENVDVRVESTLGTHEFLEKDFNVGGN